MYGNDAKIKAHPRPKLIRFWLGQNGQFLATHPKHYRYDSRQSRRSLNPCRVGSAPKGNPPKIPAGFASIAYRLGVLEHSKFALNVAFFVRHEYFLHPKSGNLQEVSRESVHIYTRSEGQILGLLGLLIAPNE